jgi:hypothetical protein
MPSPTERNTKRRKRVAAAIGLLFAIAGGLAYATTRDGGQPTDEPAALAAPAPSAGSDAAPGSTDASSPDGSTAPSSDGADAPNTKTTGRSTVLHPAVTTTSPTPDTSVLPTAPGDTTDPGFETAHRPTHPETATAADFTVAGDPADVFSPGVSQPLDLVITNPNDSDLTVSGLTVTVGPASLSGCSAGNLVVTRNFSGTVTVPAHSTHSLSSLNVPEAQWPAITMPASSSSQDACKTATFQLTYTGTGSLPS